MLSEQQANTIADQILMQELEAQTNIKNSRAKRFNRSHWLYQFPELAALQPWQRKVLIQRAMDKADQQWPVLLSCLVWLLGYMAIIFLGPPSFQSFRGFLIATVVLGIPFVVIRRRQIRRNADALCREAFPE